jgi:hypothetical protein
MTSKVVHNRVHGPTQCGTTAVTTRCTKGDRKPDGCRCTPGAGLSRQPVCTENLSSGVVVMKSAQDGA